jgi:hypothetical protein
MKWCLLMTVALAGMGCATAAAVGPAGGGPARGGVSPSEAPETPVVMEGGPEEPTVVIEATSPTEIRYRTQGETVVRLRRPPGPSHVRIRTHEGMGIGAGIGAIAGVMAGAANERNASADPDCAGGACVAGPILSALVFGAIGLGLGAAAGSIVGKLEGP